MTATPLLDGPRKESSATPVPLAAPGPRPAVCSYNEWDPLEEVIVGVVQGACVPSWDLGLEATMPEGQHGFYRDNGGKPFPPEQVAAAERELDEFVHILRGEGVTVRRPDPIDFTRPYATPDWTSPGGLYAAMPRDLLLVVGDLIIESPMSWRSRYYEVHAYRRLLKEYFLRGARWVSAPRPELKDDLYDREYDPAGRGRFVTNEWEPVFDAADFMRCGRDIFVQRSHVTNWVGIEWVRRQLGDDFQVHELTFNDPHPMHIDATLMPLAPGKLLIHPERVPEVPLIFRGWDVRTAPAPRIPESHTLYMTSPWVNMNVLMLDHERVIVEREDEPMIRAMESFGLKPIPCSFLNFNTFGGSFHCATVDVRRKGTLESYF
jgi:glycine amidinotransferase